jgi:hypothetical protein
VRGCPRAHPLYDTRYEGTRSRGLQVRTGRWISSILPCMSDGSHSNGSFSAEARRRFYEDHRSLALFMILVVFAAPFAGLYVAGLLGVAIGVLLSAAAYVLIPWLW